MLEYIINYNILCVLDINSLEIGLFSEINSTLPQTFQSLWFCLFSFLLFLALSLTSLFICIITLIWVAMCVLKNTHMAFSLEFSDKENMS